MKAARFLLPLLVPVTFAACGANDDHQPWRRENLSDVSLAGTACPGANTVEGVDVSEYQAGYNFNTAKSQGKKFAVVRVSDGLYHQDSSFATFYPAVKAAGLVRGVYQFFEPSQDPIAQADLVLKKIGGKLEPGDLPPTIDLEVSGDNGSKTKAWLDHIEQHLGVKPMIYVGYYFWTGNMGNPSGFGGYPLWIAGYVTCPSIPNEWSKWTFWQYSDGGGSLDHDKFNGTLDQLLAFAKKTAPYEAQFVKQSWPLASQPPVDLVIGETKKGSITMKNIGTATWKAGVTKLAPIPRDKASSLAADSWLKNTRVSTIAKDVPPGGTGTFEWDLKGNQVGDFDAYWGFVEEGVTWFADAPKGGGPNDHTIEVKVHVANADYRALFVSQTYPASTKGAVMLDVGQTVTGSITMKNIGNKPWKAGVTKLAPIPRDKASPFQAGTWLSSTRVSTIPADVAPGAEGTFELDLTGMTPGDTQAHFALVEEGVTWFADLPLGGGPADDFLTVHVVVGDATGAGGSSTGGAGGTSGGTGGSGGAHAGSGGAHGGSAGSGGHAGTTSTGGSGGGVAEGGAAGEGGAEAAGAGGDSGEPAGSDTELTGDPGSSGGCDVGGRAGSNGWIVLVALGAMLSRKKRSAA